MKATKIYININKILLLLFSITIFTIFHGTILAKKHVDEDAKKEARQLFNEGLKYTQSDDPDDLIKAKTAFTKAIQIDPYYVDAFAELSLVYLDLHDSLDMSLKNLKTAFELAKHVIELAPDKPVGYRTLADLMYEIGQIDESIQLIKKALFIDANDPKSLFVQGKINLFQDPETAIKNFKMAISNSKNPEPFIAYYVVAISKVEPIKRQISLLEELLSKHETTEVLIALAENYTQVGEAKKAIEAYNKILKIHPHDLRTRINIAIIKYLKLKRYDDAYNDIKDSLVIKEIPMDDGSKAVVYGHMGIIRVFQKRSKDALKNFKKALKLEPESIDLANAISFAYQDNKLHKDSLDFYDIAMEIAPQNSVYYALKASVLSQHFKSYKKAIALLQKALEISPEEIQYYNEIAFTYYFMTDYEKALTNFNESLKRDPTDGITHYNKGCVLSLMNRTKEAFIALKTSFKFSPELIQNAKSDPDLNNVRNDGLLKNSFKNSKVFNTPEEIPMPATAK